MGKGSNLKEEGEEEGEGEQGQEGGGGGHRVVGRRGGGGWRGAGWVLSPTPWPPSHVSALRTSPTP